MPSVIITGASAGIGRSLAYEFAKQGYSLGILARREDKLNEIKKDLLRIYPSSFLQVEVAHLDVANTNQVFEVIPQMVQAFGTVDMIIANAGIAERQQTGTPFEKKSKVIQTNLLGTIATIDASLAIFEKQGFGHAVAISSLAGFRGIARNAIYCASKAGLSIYMEALIAEYQDSPIHLTCLNPGFIDTEINQDVKLRPFVISPDRAAVEIYQLLEKKVEVSSIPVMPWMLLEPLIRLMPGMIVKRLGMAARYPITTAK